MSAAQGSFAEQGLVHSSIYTDIHLYLAAMALTSTHLSSAALSEQLKPLLRFYFGNKLGVSFRANQQNS